MRQLKCFFVVEFIRYIYRPSFRHPATTTLKGGHRFLRYFLGWLSTGKSVLIYSFLFLLSLSLMVGWLVGAFSVPVRLSFALSDSCGCCCWWWSDFSQREIICFLFYFKTETPTTPSTQTPLDQEHHKSRVIISFYYSAKFEFNFAICFPSFSPSHSHFK